MMVLLYAILGPACGSDPSDKEDGLIEMPPGRPCEPHVPAGMDPTAGVSFDRDHMLCVKVEMDAGDYEKLVYDSRFGTISDEIWDTFFTLLADCTRPWPSGFTWFTAQVEVDGVKLERVGIRKKGFLGSIFSLSPALKIKTDKHVDEQYLGDTERITLNNSLQDASRIRTCLAYGLIDAAGYPAPRCNLANVMVNGQSLGAYAHVEAIKKRFLRRTFGDNDGSLYEGTLTDLVEAWLPRWDIKTSDTDESRQPLLNIVRALEKPDDALIEALSPLLNIDRFLTFWALEVLVGHSDGYASYRNNFYVYFDPNDGDRAVFVPWGMDNVFSDSHKGEGRADLSIFVNAELPRRLSRIPAMATRFDNELARLLDDVWDEDALLADIDRYAAQVRTAQINDAYDADLEALRGWVRGRRERMGALLERGLPRGGGESVACYEEKDKG